MEKYIVIIIVVIIGYITYKCLSATKEGFTDAITTVGVDDSNAINILAKVAKDLQEGGGLKVLGKINCTAGGRFTNPSGADSGGYEFLHDNLTQGIGLGYNTIYAAGTYADQPLGLKAKGTGAINLNSTNTNINGNLNVTGTLKVPIDVWHQSNDNKNRVYYGNSGTTYYGSSNGEHRFRIGDNGNIPEVVMNKDGIKFNARDILGELNALRAELDDVKNNYIRKDTPIRLRRTGNDGNEGAYFKGDGWVGPNDGWSTWRLFRA